MSEAVRSPFSTPRGSGGPRIAVEELAGPPRRIELGDRIMTSPDDIPAVKVRLHEFVGMVEPAAATMTLSLVQGGAWNFFTRNHLSPTTIDAWAWCGSGSRRPTGPWSVCKRWDWMPSRARMNPRAALHHRAVAPWPGDVEGRYDLRWRRA